MPQKKQTISGLILDPKTKRGIAGLQIEAWEQDVKLLDLLGRVATSQKGEFQFTLDESQWKDNYKDQNPIVFFRVFDTAGNLLRDTRGEIFWTAKQSTKQIIIPVELTTESKPITMANVISGKLINEWNRGIADIYVKLSQITGPGKTQSLATGKTDCNGQFSLTYPELPKNDNCGAVIFELVFRKNAKSSLHEVRYELSDAELLTHLEAKAQQKIWEGSEWNWYSKVISELVSATELEHKDTISWLHKITGIGLSHLEAYLSARKMTTAMNVPAHYLYAFFRMGIQLQDRNELAKHSLIELEEILSKSIENYIISNYKNEWGAFVKIWTAIKQQSDQAKVKHTLNERFAFETPLKDLLQLASLTTAEQNKVGAYLTQKKYSSDFWQDLNTEIGLSKNKIEKVKGTFLLHDILLGNQALTKTNLTTGSKALASYTTAQWTKLIGGQKKFIEQFPGDNYNEKRNFYLNAIFTKLEQAHPMPFFKARLAEHKSFPNQSKVLNFLNKNPKFEFGKQSIKKYIRANKQALSGVSATDKKDLLQTIILSQVQYLAALPGENFKTVRILQSMKLKSMTEILHQGSAFLPKYIALGGSEKGGLTLIENVKTIAGFAIQSYAVAHESQNLPAVLQNQTAQDLVVDPELKALFGSQDNCTCEHCRSIYSPAAYLADALHFLEREQLLADEEEIRLADSNSLYALLTHDNRRPDIKKLLLNCENANTPIPYIDIVNEVLLNAIDERNEIAIDTTRSAEELAAYPVFTNTVASDAVLSILKNAIFPFSLPFDYHKTIAASWWKHLGTSPIEIQTIVHPNKFDLSTLCKTQFDFSEIEWKRITGYNKEINEENEVIEIPEAELWGDKIPKYGKGNVKDWLDKTRLSLEEFTEVVNTKFVQAEGAPQIYYFIEQADGTNTKTCNLDEAEFAWYASINGSTPERKNINKKQRERIYKFIRLWKKLNWKIEDIDALIANVFFGVINADNLIQLYPLAKLSEKWKVNPQDLLPIWYKQTTEFLDERNIFYNLSDLNNYQVDDISENWELEEFSHPFQSPEKTLEFLEYMDRFRIGGFDYFQLKYLLNKSSENAPQDILRKIPSLKEEDAQKLTHLFLEHRAKSSHLFFEYDILSILKNIEGLLFPKILNESENQRLQDVLQQTPLSLENLVEVKINEILNILNLSETEKEKIEPQLNEILLADQRTKTIPVFFEYNLQHILAKIEELLNAETWNEDLKIQLQNVLLLPHDSSEDFVVAKTKKILTILQIPQSDLDEISQKVISILNSELEVANYNYILNFLELRFNFPASSLYELLPNENDTFSIEIKELHKEKPFDDHKNSLAVFHKLSILFGNLTDLNNSFLSVYQLIKSDIQRIEKDIQITPVTLVKIGLCSHIFKLYPQLNPKEILSFLTAKNEIDIATPVYDWNDFNRFFEWDLMSKQWEGFELTKYINGEKPLEGFLNLHQLVLLIQKVQLPASVLTFDEINGLYIHELQSAIKNKISEQQWHKQAKNIYGSVREKLRDALVSHLLHTNTNNLTSEEDLYKHFLLDTQMSACMMTSRLLQAILSLQLFVQRCLMNLEPNIKTSNSEDWKQWEWMNRYRVWEANRKVFAYPENWIEPELRDDRSPFFQELESELMQNEMTSDLGETALRNYLHKLEGVSNLEIMAMCRAHEDIDASKDSYYIFGRTYGLPQQLYFRKYVLSRSWTAWEKVEVDAEGDHLVPVIHNGKLHLFWPIFREKAIKQSRTVPTAGEDIQEDLIYWEIRMAWSVFENKKWGAKKMSKIIVSERESDHLIKYRDLDLRKKKMQMFFKDNVLNIKSQQQNPFTEKRVITKQEIHSFLEQKTEGQIRNLLKAKVASYDYSGELGLSSDEYYEFEIYFIQIQRNGNFSQVLYNIYFTIWPKHATNFKSFAKLKFDGNDLTKLILEPNEALQVNPIFENNKISVADDRYIFFNGSYYFISSVSSSQIIVSQEQSFSSELDVVDMQASFYNGNLQAPFIFQDSKNSFLMTIKNNRLSLENLNFGSSAGLIEHHFSRGWLHQKLDFAVNYNQLFAFHYSFDRRYIDISQIEPHTSNLFISGHPGSIYNWEILFHIPMYVAGQLSKNNRYEEAQKWYHLIFNPTANSEEETAARYWVFIPFRETYRTNAAGRPLNIVEILMLLHEAVNTENDDDYITNTAKEVQRQIEDWRDNPFEPHRIARVRIGAYMKNVVMKYIDNLIAWGDELFRQDTMESITEATQIYMLAWEVLGGKPEKIPSTDSEALSYEQLKTEEGVFDEFSNKLVELEEKIQVTVIRQQVAIGSYRNGTIPVNPGFGFNVHEPWSVVATNSTKKWRETQIIQLKNLYFCIPENEKLAGYWSTVSDRFFKLRNCMNIDGALRQLPLYQPPIDPALLVRANAMGLSIADALSDLNTSLPHYRFQIMLQKAMEYTQEVKSLSSAFLGALQSKDAEEFSLLRARHELTMLDTMRQIRKDNIHLAREAVNSMELSKQMAESRLDYYRSKEKLDSGEKEQLQQIGKGLDFQEAAFATNILANVMFHIPDLTIGPFSSGSTSGGRHFGHAISQIAESLNQYAGITSSKGNLAATKSSYNRRWEEWKHQEQQTALDLKRIEKELLSAEIRLALAEKEAENHELQIAQSQEQLDYMKSKFTNAQLYNWMSTELSKLYRSSFEMAYQLAKKAEKAWQHELGMNDQFVKYGHWDSLYKGLLSGEKLMNDLRRMETAYLDKNEREYELIKHVSLAQLDPLALLLLREDGACEFEIPEVLFDMDYPGQYFRRLKSVSISIPCITGPYTSVNAKLTLQKSRYRKNTTVDTAYAEKTENTEMDDRFVYSLGASKAIATSHGQNDSGIFELNFRDERYLPFEGAGAISNWKLELPNEIKQFNHATISDVILHVKYTAKEGGLILKDAANNSLKEQLERIQQSLKKSGLHTLLNLKQDMPNEWHLLKKNGNTPLTFSKSRLPYMAQGFNATIQEVTILSKTANDQTEFRIDEAEWVSLEENKDLKLYEGVVTNISIDEEFKLSFRQFEELEEVLMFVKYVLE